MLRRILVEFRLRFGIGEEVPEHPDAVCSAIPNWRYMAAAKGRIVLDALNQPEEREGALDLLWLPPVMPENFRLLVSTLSGRAPDEIIKRKWLVFKVEPLDIDERKELIRQFLFSYGRQLRPARIECLAAASLNEILRQIDEG